MMNDKNVKAYPVSCCVCNHKFYASKSIAMDMGKLDAGHGSCPNCNTFLNLTFVPEQNRMVSTKWEDYLNTLKRNDN